MGSTILVLSQFARLEAIRARRAELARRYLAVLPVGFKVQARVSEPGRMIYRFVLIAPNRGARDALKVYMEQHDVVCITPIERYELLHRYLKLDPDNFPVAEALADTTLSMPLYPSLSDAEVDRICAVLQDYPT